MGCLVRMRDGDGEWNKSGSVFEWGLVLQWER